MRIKIELTGEKKTVLPTGFNSAIQGMIYSFFDKESATWLHEKGFKFEKRSFKMFTFSPFLEKAYFDKSKKLFSFPIQLSFLFSSPVQWICEQFAINFIKQKYVILNNQKLYINSVNILKCPDINGPKVKIRAITPVEVHSTFEKKDGKKITHYYTPFDNEFNELVNSNLRKKWESFKKEKCPHNIAIKPLFSGNRNEKIQYFRKNINGKTIMIVIKGWKGYFELEGDPEFIKFAYDCGLGSHNPSGWGMFEVMHEKKSQGTSEKL